MKTASAIDGVTWILGIWWVLLLLPNILGMMGLPFGGERGNSSWAVVVAAGTPLLAIVSLLLAERNAAVARLICKLLLLVSVLYLLFFAVYALAEPVAAFGAVLVLFTHVVPLYAQQTHLKRRFSEACLK